MPILPMIKIDEKVSSMYGQHYEEKPSQVQEECDPEVYGENAEKETTKYYQQHWRPVHIILDGC